MRVGYRVSLPQSPSQPTHTVSVSSHPGRAPRNAPAVGAQQAAPLLPAWQAPLAPAAPRLAERLKSGLWWLVRARGMPQAPVPGAGRIVGRVLVRAAQGAVVGGVACAIVMTGMAIPALFAAACIVVLVGMCAGLGYVAGKLPGAVGNFDMHRPRTGGTGGGRAE